MLFTADEVGLIRFLFKNENIFFSNNKTKQKIYPTNYLLWL